MNVQIQKNAMYKRCKNNKTTIVVITYALERLINA